MTPRDVEDDVDRRVLRRAVTVGVVSVVVLGVPATVAAGVAGSAALVLAGALSALTVGVLLAAGWVLVSVVVDAVAGDPSSGRRLLWGLGLGVVGFVLPVLVLAALSLDT